MRSLSEQIAAAELFARTARFHLDNPRPERLDQVRRELLDALGAKEVPLGEGAAEVLAPFYLQIANSAEAIELLHHMIDVGYNGAAVHASQPSRIAAHR